MVRTKSLSPYTSPAVGHCTDKTSFQPFQILDRVNHFSFLKWTQLSLMHMICSITNWCCAMKTHFWSALASNNLENPPDIMLASSPKLHANKGSFVVVSILFSRIIPILNTQSMSLMFSTTALIAFWGKVKLKQVGFRHQHYLFLHSYKSRSKKEEGKHEGTDHPQLQHQTWAVSQSF